MRDLTAMLSASVIAAVPSMMTVATTTNICALVRHLWDEWSETQQARLCAHLDCCPLVQHKSGDCGEGFRTQEESVESRDYKIPRVRDLVTTSLRFSRKFLK